jgi:uncharacterized protein (TIGR02588 family)
MMQKKSKKRSPAEKVSFIISLFIVSVIFFLVCLAWITGDNNPPILSVTTGSKIRQINQQYYVPFSVTNSGGETVETVEIMAELSFDGEDYETGTQEIDFLSRKEEQSGEFIFSRDPQQGELTIRVASYKLP